MKRRAAHSIILMILVGTTAFAGEEDRSPNPLDVTATGVVGVVTGAGVAAHPFVSRIGADAARAEIPPARDLERTLSQAQDFSAHDVARAEIGINEQLKAMKRTSLPSDSEIADAQRVVTNRENIVQERKQILASLKQTAKDHYYHRGLAWAILDYEELGLPEHLAKATETSNVLKGQVDRLLHLDQALDRTNTRAYYHAEELLNLAEDAKELAKKKASLLGTTLDLIKQTEQINKLKTVARHGAAKPSVVRTLLGAGTVFVLGEVATQGNLIADGIEKVKAPVRASDARPAETETKSGGKLE